MPQPILVSRRPVAAPRLPAWTQSLPFAEILLMVALGSVLALA